MSPTLTLKSRCVPGVTEPSLPVSCAVWEFWSLAQAAREPATSTTARKRVAWASRDEAAIVKVLFVTSPSVYSTSDEGDSSSSNAELSEASCENVAEPTANGQGAKGSRHRHD